jgi:uncharacterized protein GlcG (DUF336 family)
VDVLQEVNLSYQLAADMVAAAVQVAKQQGLNVAVAVLDRHGALRAFAALDGCPVLAAEACKAKAYTALLGMGSAELGDALVSSPAMLASFAAQPGVAMLGGGLPVFFKGEVIGAIGVGGASTEQDIACAQAALDAICS